MNIRIATPADAESLLKIYAPYVTETAITFEYDVPSVSDFAQRIANTLLKYPYLVAQQDEQILGYAYAGCFHARAAYDWAVETSIYVDRRSKGKGVGGRLYGALENALKGQGFLNMNACIAYPETEDEYLTKNSVEFHAHMGYRYVGRFRQCGYKFGRWYDMVWMEKHIGKHCGNQSAPKAFAEISETLKQEYGIR